MHQSVIVRVIWEGTTYDLDIQKDIPLRLDVSAIENTEIGEFFGVGSQTFDIAGTKENNRFFGHAYNVGAEDIPGFSNTIDGMIVVNGDVVLKGQFQLLEVIKDEEGFVVYKCQITDGTVQFKDAIQNKLIKNADWSSYNHTLDTGSILDSWEDNLLSGSVFYPFAEFGVEDPANPGSFPLFSFGEPDSFGNVTGNFLNNPLTPLQPQQLIPAIKARDVLDVIFGQTGFTPTGSFIESEDFSNLYILPKASEAAGVVVSGSEQPTCYVVADFNQTITNPGIGNTEVDPLLVNQIINDPQSKVTAYSSSGSYYNADGLGEYEVAAGASFFNPIGIWGAADAEVEIELQVMVGTYPFGGTVVASNSITLTKADGFNTFSLSAGGTWNNTNTSNQFFAFINYKIIAGTGIPDLNLFGFGSVLRVDRGPVNFTGATVDMGLQWPTDLKSIDILTGLIQQFNLVLIPSLEQDKTIEIHQFDEWIRNGEVKDWTEKWDTAERVSINHTIDEEPQELILGNEDDSDRFSLEAKESDPFFQYGTLRILADNNISQGSKTIKNTFGPVVLGGPFESGSLTAEGVPTYNIDLGSSFAFPHLYNFKNGNLKSYKFRPRLGYQVINEFPSGSDLVVYIGNQANSTAISGSYATLSNTNELPATSNSKDLHFNNSYFKFAGPALNLSGTRSNFDTYWKTYIDSLYWDGNRKVTLDVLFSPEEYKDIKLNDIIFIKDQRYRINKISGYNLVDDDVVTVELIRLYPAYSGQINCEMNWLLEETDASFNFVAERGGAVPTPTPTSTPVSTATPTPTPTATTAGISCGLYEVSWTSPYYGAVGYTCCHTGQYKNINIYNNPGKYYITSRTFPNPSVGGGAAFRGTVTYYDTNSLDLSQIRDYEISFSGSVGSADYGFSFYSTASCDIECTVTHSAGTTTTISTVEGGLTYGIPGVTILSSGSLYTNPCYTTPTPTPTPTPSATPSAGEAYIYWLYLTGSGTASIEYECPGTSQTTYFDFSGSNQSLEFVSKVGFQPTITTTNDYTLLSGSQIPGQSDSTRNIPDTGSLRQWKAQSLAIGSTGLSDFGLAHFIDTGSCQWVCGRLVELGVLPPSQQFQVMEGSTISWGLGLYVLTDGGLSGCAPTPTPTSTGIPPTPTPTPTSTPTTPFATQSIDGYYNIGTYGICNEQRFPGPVYKYSQVDYVELGDVLYEDEGLTTPLFGWTNFLESDTNIMWLMYASGDDAGEVYDSGSGCPTPTPTPTQTPTPTATSTVYTHELRERATIDEYFCGGTYISTRYSIGGSTLSEGDQLWRDADLNYRAGTNYYYEYSTGKYWYKLDAESGVTEISNPCPTPTATPTQTPTPTPSATPTPTVDLRTYTGDASWSSFYDACNNGTSVTVYTDGAIGEGKTVYSNSSLTTVFSFYQYLVLDSTGVGYQFPDPNTTGVVQDVNTDPCNIGTFSLGVDFNEYEACTGCVTTTKYSDSSTFQVGMDLYTDVELNYDWTEGIGVQFAWSGSLYEYDGAARFGGNGVVDLSTSCYTVSSFNASDSSATTAPTWFCGSTPEKTLYVKDTPGVGKEVFTDSCLTDNVNTSQLWIYNHDTDELYAYDGTIASVTSSYCPPTPTPSSTPTPTPTPTPGPTPTPTPTEAPWNSYSVEPCFGSGTYYYRYQGTLPSNYFYDGQCYRVLAETTYYDTDPIIPEDFYSSCTDCDTFN